MSTKFEAAKVVEEACKELDIRLPDLVALASFWVHPKVVADAAGPLHPNRRRANLGLRIDGKQVEARGMVIDGVILDDNTYANTAFKQALGVGRGGFVGFHVCHIWPGTAYDPACFTHLANLVGIPADLAALSDHHEQVIACLKYRSWELYGWHPPTSGGPPAKPENYPTRWREPIPRASKSGAKRAVPPTSIEETAPLAEADWDQTSSGETGNSALQLPADSDDWELWAAYYLSKFDHQRLRLGNQGETIDRVAARLGVKRTSFKHRRDAFDAYTGSYRRGWHQAPLAPNLQSVYSRLRDVEEAALRAAVLQMLALARAANQP